jgi:hypothetical protein
LRQAALSHAGPTCLCRPLQDGTFKIKTEVLHTKLLIMASLRRRMALVGAMSHRIRELMSSSAGRSK